MKMLRISASMMLVMFMAMGICAIAFAQDSETDETNTTTTTTTSITSSGTSDTSTSSTGSDGRATGRPRIAVYTFENPPNYYNSTIGNGLTSIVTTYLVQSGRFDVIQRGENLDLIIEEISLGQSGYIEQETAVEMGHVLGVEYILSGRVTNFGYEEQSTGGFLSGFGGFGGLDISEEEAVVRLDFVLVDATTGETVLAAAAEGKESDTGVYVEGGNWGDWFGNIEIDSDEFMDSMIGKATLKAIDNLMAQVLELFPIQAPILAVTPDFVIIGLGSNGKIEEGMEFEVFDITDITNEAGEVVWQDETLIGRVRVTEVDLTTCKAAVVTGTGFTEGDLCILVDEDGNDDDDDNGGSVRDRHSRYDD